MSQRHDGPAEERSPLSAPLSPVHLLLARRLGQAVGEAITCERRPYALGHQLSSRVDSAAPDQWFLLGHFTDNRRTSAAFQSASGVVLDLDWGDPGVPSDEPEAHQPIRERDRARIVAALRSYGVPGCAYLTPRGLRVIHVLEVDVSDPEVYGELVAAASRHMLNHLRGHGVTLLTSSDTGLQVIAGCSVAGGWGLGKGSPFPSGGAARSQRTAG